MNQYAPVWGNYADFHWAPIKSVKSLFYGIVLCIDLFHHTAAHRMQFCALVNKYFSYFVLAYPFCAFPSSSFFNSNQLVHDLHIRWLIPAAWCHNPINVSPNSNRGMIYDRIYAVLLMHFSVFIRPRSIKLFKRFGKHFTGSF